MCRDLCEVIISPWPRQYPHFQTDHHTRILLVINPSVLFVKLYSGQNVIFRMIDYNLEKQKGNVKKSGWLKIILDLIVLEIGQWPEVAHC